MVPMPFRHFTWTQRNRRMATPSVSDWRHPASICRAVSIDRVPPACLNAFRDGLREHGSVEGQTSPSKSGTPTAMKATSPRLRPIWFGYGLTSSQGPGATTRVAREVTSATPIVMIAGANPVDEGLAAPLARPGGNVAGTAD